MRPAPTVLVVEPHPLVRGLVAAVLGGAGFSVVTAGRLDAPWPSPFRAAVVDLNTPGLPPLTTALRPQELASRLVLTSAVGHTAEDLVALGADAGLPKPFGVRQMLAAVRGTPE